MSQSLTFLIFHSHLFPFSHHNAIAVLLYSRHMYHVKPLLCFCVCFSGYLLCFESMLFSLLLSFFFQWLDFVKLHYVYLKITSGVPVLSILSPSEELQALSFSTAVCVSHYKGSHVEYKQRQQHSRLPVGFPAEITINISVSKNCSITCWCSYCRPIQLSLKKKLVK